MSFFDQDLHQFSTYLKPINLAFHQYLLLTGEPLLLHTGNMEQASALLPQLEKALDGKLLKYIFVSHFEADECGGLSLILKHSPDAKTICSEVTGRQLRGFGLENDIIIKKPGERLSSSDYELEFIAYPSEMHLWEGLLVMEHKRRIFFSSDLMIRPGEAKGLIMESNWKTEIDSIRPDQVPDPERRSQLQATLGKLSPLFVAAGHGPCLKLI